MRAPEQLSSESLEVNPYQATAAPGARGSTGRDVADSVPASHPTGFWFFFWGELAERCSYYGMRAILALYMADELGFGQDHANGMMHSFIAACYLLPLAGGFVADRYFGKYWTIVGFSIPYIIGQLLIGIENAVFLVLSLTLLAMGSGVIKPNISTLMGLTYDQQRPGLDKLRSDAFAWFYFSINIGAALSSFAVPVIRSHWGYQIAFLFPAGLMAIAFVVFALGKPHYATEHISKEAKTPEQRSEQWSVLARIWGLFAVVTFFWSIFDQATSTWTFFAKDYLDRNVLGWTIEPDMIQGVNPILILILLPPMTFLWRFLSDRGINLRATDKMFIGFLLTTFCMGLMAAAGFLTSTTDKVSVLWEIGAYVVMTAAEICISVVGLELAFTAAPKHMKGFVTACWLVTVFIGNLFAMIVTHFYTHLGPGLYFSALTVLMVVVTGSFLAAARRFNRAV